MAIDTSNMLSNSTKLFKELKGTRDVNKERDTRHTLENVGKM